MMQTKGTQSQKESSFTHSSQSSKTFEKLMQELSDLNVDAKTRKSKKILTSEAFVSLHSWYKELSFFNTNSRRSCELEDVDLAMCFDSLRIWLVLPSLQGICTSLQKIREQIHK